jgi:hypothetical protein
MHLARPRHRRCEVARLSVRGHCVARRRFIGRDIAIAFVMSLAIPAYLNARRISIVLAQSA